MGVVSIMAWARSLGILHWDKVSTNSVTTFVSHFLLAYSQETFEQPWSYAQAEPALHRLCTHVLQNGSAAEPHPGAQVQHHRHSMSLPCLPQ